MFLPAKIILHLSWCSSRESMSATHAHLWMQNNLCFVISTKQTSTSSHSTPVFSKNYIQRQSDPQMEVIKLFHSNCAKGNKLISPATHLTPFCHWQSHGSLTINVNLHFPVLPVNHVLNITIFS